MNFVIIGMGFVSERHLRAIKENGGNLLAATDPHDSVGILDKYFPECEYFSEFERFGRHCEKLKRQGTSIDYVSICSPSYLHDVHCRFALRLGADAICEKPLVIKSYNIEVLKDLEKKTGKRIYVILQLRLHPNIRELKNLLPENKLDVTLNYYTPRGKWYYNSWKSDKQKSGGLLMNIGIHCIDLFIWLFGTNLTIKTFNLEDDSSCFVLENERSYITCLLSINTKQAPLRKLVVNSKEIDFSAGFTDLHTKCYFEILAGRGFGIEDSRPSIELVNKMNSNIYP